MTGALQPDRGSYLTPTLQHATVAEAMHPGILSCPADAPLIEVARLMATHHVHCVAVMGLSEEDHVSDKVVWGIVSDLDLVRVGVRTGTDRTAGDAVDETAEEASPTAAATVGALADLLHADALVSALRARTADPGQQAARQSPCKEDFRAACAAESDARPGTGATPRPDRRLPATRGRRGDQNIGRADRQGRRRAGDRGGRR